MNIDTNMFGTIDIAVSGLKAYNRQMQVVGSNMANVQTTDNGDGRPYRRLIARFEAVDEGGGGVEIKDIVKDNSDFQRILKPGHPDADANGYVAMPNVDWPTEMITLNAASRAYQANAAILKRYQTMIESSLELLK
ncbi:MAG: flagellar basal body rod protein FlgC [Planctomycetaceae bacterium]|nr:flagellar basal body rod protein FlgC [Planctomycetaceae bacterium]